jgi:hypothetical protein
MKTSIDKTNLKTYIYTYPGTTEALTTQVCRWGWRRSEIKLAIGNH